MLNRKTLLLLSVMTLFGATAIPAAARVNVAIDIGVPPPAAQVEVVPVPRAGYVWEPGYWRWAGRRHVWVQGRRIRERRGYAWVPERWVEVERGHRYHFEPGRWERVR